MERFFAHLMRSRRLVRDFERSTSSAEALAYRSMTTLMTRRLTTPNEMIFGLVGWPSER
ncbi:hypothetical protein ACFRFJ_16555 [Streptomyces hydrogenans]|uniref:hypothetical protein n=1 Tax=Streptomyces hydrogenans TaxID=1873719 RepID=UPI003697E617